MSATPVGKTHIPNETLAKRQQQQLVIPN